MIKLTSLVIILALGSCGSAPTTELNTWGSMKTVLAQGKTAARIALADAITPHSVGVGALAGLEGELTILDGVIHAARVTPNYALTSTKLTGSQTDDSATLLAICEVAEWETVLLGEVSSLSALETIVAAELIDRGFDMTQPVPFKVEATFSEISIHVLNNSCPIANPDGPEPWRGHFNTKNGQLIGLYAVGFGGELTHHGSDSHIHAIVLDGDVVNSSGHAESFALEPGSILYLPK